MKKFLFGSLLGFSILFACGKGPQSSRPDTLPDEDSAALGMYGTGTMTQTSINTNTNPTGTMTGTGTGTNHVCPAGYELTSWSQNGNCADADIARACSAGGGDLSKEVLSGSVCRLTCDNYCKKKTDTQTVTSTATSTN